MYQVIGSPEIAVFAPVTGRLIEKIRGNILGGIYGGLPLAVTGIAVDQRWDVPPDTPVMTYFKTWLYVPDFWLDGTTLRLIFRCSCSAIYDSGTGNGEGKVRADSGSVSNSVTYLTSTTHDFTLDMPTASLTGNSALDIEFGANLLASKSGNARITHDGYAYAQLIA